MKPIDEILGAHSRRTTRPRRDVFEMLQGSREPLSIHDITQRLSHIDRVSIYRTLELFARLSIVEVVHVGWKKRYELANTYQNYHHHHLIRAQCGSITEINSDQLEHVIHSLSDAYQFTPTGHTFEITGLCSSCR